MATKKAASKTAAKKPARPEKKAATKARPADTSKTTAKKTDARAGETKSKAAKKTKSETKSAASAAAKAPKVAKAAAPTPAKETKTTTPPTPTSRRSESAPAAAAPAAPARKRSGPPRTVAVTVGSPVVSKLGTKWSCFRCGSRFYDLNKPEPLCPKCGADQRERPKVTIAPTPAPPAAKKAPRPMAPLLDDEDDGTVRYDEEFDLGVRADIDETEEDLFPAGDVEEEDVFGGDEE